MQERVIYLDHGATTPVHPQVLEAMLPYWRVDYGNPSSHHTYGRRAGIALEEARESIARQIGAKPEEIIFTGCGSESDNLALRGAMLAARAAGRGNHLIISTIEHSAVKRTAAQLQALFDFEVSVLPVDEHGRVAVADVAAAMRPDTALISIMAANNEIGTLQPIAAIGELARERGVLMHTDAIQAIAVQEWDMTTMPYDLLSIAPHKFYGPKGIGMLYIREGVELVSTLTGGGQEEGLRAGTSNVAYAVGAAKALEIAMATLPETVAHYRALRDRLIAGICDGLPGTCRLTGHPTERLPHNASFAMRDVSGNDLLMHLDMAGIAASSGSACKSGDPKPSAALEALGLSPEWTKGGLRLTVGRDNTPQDIDFAVEVVVAAVEKLQQLNRVLG